jgi:hypothetical protein
MAVKRQAFSLANDSAQDLNRETNRYSRIRAGMVTWPEPKTSGKRSVGHRVLVQREMENWRFAVS